jgi:Phosphodiester glycosidase
MPGLDPRTLAARSLRAPRAPHLRRERLTLADGARTTLWVARYELARTELRVVRLRRAAPLEAWCEGEGLREALVGGFYLRDPGGPIPLGELRTRGIARRYIPFAAPFDAERACVHAFRGQVRIAPRPEIEAQPRGDLLQAGPLLVRSGHVVYVDGQDCEGFSASAHQFDSDITAERHPRAALGVTDRHLLAVACDGRARGDAGLTLGELALALTEFGAIDALNLDGGGSTSLVCSGRLRNRPREQHGVELPGGRPVATALVFASR